MIKTYLTGLVLGLAGAAALLYYARPVDLHREPTSLSVRPNGGISENFHINLPHDRVLAGSRSAGNTTTFPAGVRWPGDAGLEGLHAEVFKIRNKADRVVGIATRLSSDWEENGDFVQWMVHLPARGTLYANLNTVPSGEGLRGGQVVSGTREFEWLTGNVSEHFDGDVTEADLGISGRLELTTRLVSRTGGE